MEEIKPDNPICPYCGDVTLAYVNLENEWTCKKCKNWFKNSQLVQQEFITRYLIPCHDSEFYGIDCLETEKQFGFQKDECDYRPAHQLWIDKEDAEKLIKIFYQKFAENVRHKGYDFNYNFEELNIRKEVKQEAMQTEARHSSQA